ncbi:MAG: aminotransferase class V-fold PLP-dependent enzyme [Sphingomonadales bacterium]|nr:aminotransferase class V-fold PLP-dependent enzyme [Sphingomonadales bacterium]
MSAHARREFFKKTGLFSAAGLFAGFQSSTALANLLRNSSGIADESLITDEDFWYQVQQSFTVSPSLINLNNGGVSPAPRTVQEAMKRYYDYSNETPSYYMWRILDQGREPLRQQLARLAGCQADEIAINRNSSEGLETVIFGLTLSSGDEVVASRQDYPNMINAWNQRVIRNGIKMVWVNLELPSEDEDYLVRQYVNAFTSKTKVVHLTHVINWNGQVLPVKKIAQEAHRRGIEVVVDGAHSFAHLDFKIPELEADYFATSLHKWLYAPIGSGMLYVKKEKIAGLYPLFANDSPRSEDIRKFEALGTRPFFIEQAIGKAIEFNEMLGMARKQKRLHYLKNYWMEKVRAFPGVQLHTSLDPAWGCAIGNMSVEGKTPGELDRFLLEKYKVHTVAIQWENINGIRVTPNVYTTTRQLDQFIEGVRAFTK